MQGSIHQLWQYNDWANKFLLSTMKLHGEKLPASCLRLFSHIINAQLIWLSRINGETSPVEVWQDHDLAACERLHGSSSRALEDKAARDDQGERIIVDYTNTKNEHFENSMQDILLHIFNHGTYHRAQIATEMRRNGLEPVNTDYISFVRKRSATEQL